MLLDDKFKDYLDEAMELYKKNTNNSPKSNKFFGIIEDGILKAYGSIRCYYGHWYLRGCYVKPEFRGNGFQRKLIRERIKYLKGKTNKVKVSIFQTNTYSIDNILKEGFVLEGKTKFGGQTANIYQKKI